MPFRTVAAVTAALAMLAGCAVSPAGGESTSPSSSSAPAPADDPMAPGVQSGKRSSLLFDVAGGLPMLDAGAADGGALLASRVGFGLDDDLLRYRASYRLEAGDVFSQANDAAARSTPSVLAGQHFGQNVVLTLPELVGAPLSLGVTAEVQDSWQLAGEAQTERERAEVEWSPWRATVRVQWTDQAQAFDPSLALHCNVESSLGLPLYAEGRRGALMQVSGRECVIAEGTEYAGLPVQTWGIGWSWTGDARESVAQVRVIEPLWSELALDADFDPGYQLGLRHSRDFGALSAAALVAVRQSPALLLGPEPAFAPETSWSANASLTWHLADASVSADWAQGVDPLWFMPDARAPRDRFGLALDLSPWIQTVAPGTAPVFGMRWNWSQLRQPGEGEVDENSVELNVSLLF